MVLLITILSSNSAFMLPKNHYSILFRRFVLTKGENLVKYQGLVMLSSFDYIAYVKYLKQYIFDVKKNKTRKCYKKIPKTIATNESQNKTRS